MTDPNVPPMAPPPMAAPSGHMPADYAAAPGAAHPQVAAPAPGQPAAAPPGAPPAGAPPAQPPQGYAQPPANPQPPAAAAPPAAQPPAQAPAGAPAGAPPPGYAPAAAAAPPQQPAAAPGGFQPPQPMTAAPAGYQPPQPAGGAPNPMADAAAAAGHNPMMTVDGQQSLRLGQSLCSGRYLVQIINVGQGRNNQKVPFLKVDVRVLKCLWAQEQVEGTKPDLNGNPTYEPVPHPAFREGVETAVIMKSGQYDYGEKERNTFMCVSIQIPTVDANGQLDGGMRQMGVGEITGAMCQYIFAPDVSPAIGQICVVDKRWKKSRGGNNVNQTTWGNNVPRDALGQFLTPQEQQAHGLV